ncbi:hypothetical protein MKQ68_07515 [Chitinophaga horti]|uniref:3-oxoacyl-ACP synthase n=1 Tax=Chitinophaga horti TaxID=2920382 RepID=A0ABY6J5H9_9BACT|nr:hypothetical protein [Chitinophaga horti]UYQ94940.1 hypothetical protein MKQ68_07515 [Chitinophaga horti]
MTPQEKIGFKTQLKTTAELIIRERIAATKALIDDAQEAANSEGKSSAGDKYETGRAMGHLQKDMYARQQAENQKELEHLQKINTGVIFEAVQTGAYVRCAEYSFFIAAGLGKQRIADETVFFLSPHAPLALILLHKKVGDRFLFNKKDTAILDVF